MAKKADILVTIGSKLNPDFAKPVNQISKSLGKVWGLLSSSAGKINNLDKQEQRYTNRVAKLNEKLKDRNKIFADRDKELRGKKSKFEDTKLALGAENVDLYSDNKKQEAILGLASDTQNKTDEEYQKRIDKINNQLKITGILYENAKKKKQEFETQSQELAVKRANKNAANEELKVRTKEYKEQYGDKKDKRLKAYKDLIELQKIAIKKEKEYADANKQYAATKSERDDNSTTLKSLKTKLVGQKEEVNALQKEWLQLSSSLDKTMEGANAKIDSNNKKIESNKKKIQESNNALGKTNTQLEHNKMSWESYTQDVEDKVRQLEDKISEITKRISQKVKALIFNIIIRGIKWIGNKVKSLMKDMIAPFKEIKNNLIDGKKLMRLIVQYGFGFRSLYYLVNKFKSGISEGFTYMGKSIDEVQQSLNKLKEVLYFVKSAAATALQPLLNMITILQPVIERFVTLFSKFAITLSTIFAQIAGQDYIYVATTELDAYANALDDAADSADNLSKALGAYDKLNVINQDKDSSSSDLDTSSWFTKQAIDPTNWGANFAEAVKAAIKAADFSSVGNILGEKIKELFNSIKWADWINDSGEVKKGIETLANEISKDISTFFIGLFGTDELGKTIGENLAHALNVAVDFVNNLFTTESNGKTMFGSLGDFLVEGINSALTTLDIEKLGETIRLMYDNIHDLIVKLIREIDTQSIVDVIAEIVETIFNEFGNKISLFVEIFKKLAEIIYTAFTQSNILDTVKNAFSELFGSRTIYAEEISMDGVADQISTGLSTELATMDSTTVGEGIGKLLAAIPFDTIKDGISKLVNNIGVALGSAFDTWEEENPDSYQAVVDTIQSTINALLLAVLAKFSLKVIGKAIATKLSTWLASGGLASALETIIIHLYVWLTDVLLPWITGTAIPAIGTLLASIPVWGWIALAVAAILAVIIANWDKVKEWALTAIENIKEWINKVKDKLSNIVTTVSEKFGNIFNVIKEKLTNVKTTVSTIFTDIISKVTTFVTNIYNKITTKFIAIKDKVTETIETLKENIKEKLNGIIENFEGMINGAVEGIKSWINGLKSLGTKVLEKLGFTSLTTGTLSKTYIPRLAQGAVIPPNKQFMAVLGDQKSGTNIEAPLDTIKQALAEVMSSYGGTAQPIILQLDGKTVARVVWDENKKRYRQTGKNYVY